MNMLPNDIQTLIWKMYFRNICLDELHKNIMKTNGNEMIPISVKHDWMKRTYFDVNLTTNEIYLERHPKELFGYNDLMKILLQE